ncbi:hypothetical protein JSY36_05300 [Bacillus sp. H-16]|uniref:hypothetical protein n=1 Tax=Alteribacter salitolerans TaxID=2912333 RepID=UPI0019662E30|nr:hypothetical protein [Alteribacter salitolerans]MBM7095168.1 hypothetical protein [Alteribacter salitolerans]
MNNNIDNKMAEAYKILFNLNHILIDYIKIKMTNEYGLNWGHTIKEKKDINNLHFHEII